MCVTPLYRARSFSWVIYRVIAVTKLSIPLRNFIVSMYPSATACIFLVSRYTRSLIFPNSRRKKEHTRKKHEIQRSAQPCVCAIERGSSRTAWLSFSFAFGCQQKLQWCRTFDLSKVIRRERFAEEVRLFFHILLENLALDWCNIEMPNNGTLAWWLIMRASRRCYRRSVELAGEAGDVLFFFFFFFFHVLCFFYLAPSLIFLIHVTRNKEKTHCGLLREGFSEHCGLSPLCGPSVEAISGLQPSSPRGERRSIG